MITKTTLAAGITAAILGASLSTSALAATAPQNIIVYKPTFFAAARPNTAYDMIERLPGFTFNDGDSARGFAGTGGNVVIDGERPTAKTDDLQSILERIPSNQVARIEVIRGGANGIDMHGKTVIANVVRKHDASSSLVAQASSNMWPDGEVVPRAKVDYTRNSGGWRYEASIERIGNFDDSVGTGTYRVIDGAGTVTRYKAHNAGIGEGWGFNGAVNMPLFGGRFRTNLTLEDSPFSSGTYYVHPNDNQIITDKSGDRKGELGLHWSGAIGGAHLEALTLQRLGHQTDYNVSRVPGTDEAFSSSSDTGETIARATLTYDYSPKLTFEGGAEGAYNFLDGTSGYTLNGINVPLPSANARVEERRGEVFAKGTWKFASDFTLEAGTRFEFSTIKETGDAAQSRSFFYPKPRAVLSWTPDEDTQLRLRIERAVGQLDFTNFLASSDLSGVGVSAGNADIKPDQRMQYALSYERDFWKKGAIVVTLLHEQITDAVDYVPIFASSGAFDAPGNIGNGRNDEIDVELTLPLDRIGISGGLLKATAIWRDSAVTDPLTGLKRRISGQRPQKIKINFSQDIQSLKSTWGFFYFNGWDENYYRLGSLVHRAVPPPYMQIYWEYKPTSDWSLRIEADNIIPFKYVQDQRFYSGPRNSTALIEADYLRLQSQPRLKIQIRKTF